MDRNLAQTLGLGRNRARGKLVRRNMSEMRAKYELNAGCKQSSHRAGAHITKHASASPLVSSVQGKPSHLPERLVKIFAR